MYGVRSSSSDVNCVAPSGRRQPRRPVWTADGIRRLDEYRPNRDEYRPNRAESGRRGGAIDGRSSVRWGSGVGHRRGRRPRRSRESVRPRTGSSRRSRRRERPRRHRLRGFGVPRRRRGRGGADSFRWRRRHRRLGLRGRPRRCPAHGPGGAGPMGSPGRSGVQRRHVPQQAFRRGRPSKTSTPWSTSIYAAPSW